MMPIQIQWTCDRDDKIQLIISKILEQKLAACISIVPNCTSYYHWNGKIENAIEKKIYLKTVKKHFDDIVAIIREFSGYETPEVLAFEILLIEDHYRRWLLDCIQ